MGLSLGDFLDLTPVSFLQAKSEFLKHQELSERSMWERARWMAFRIACPPQPAKGTKFLKITDFIRFPWEPVPAQKKSTKERFEYLKHKWN